MFIPLSQESNSEWIETDDISYIGKILDTNSPHCHFKIIYKSKYSDDLYFNSKFAAEYARAEIIKIKTGSNK